MKTRRIALLATDRYSINMDDLYMFFRRSNHEIAAFLLHESVPRKQWWTGGFPDKAREKRVEKVDTSIAPVHIYSTPKELRDLASRIDCDYFGMGNGNGEDQKALIEQVGRERCLFTEYGWLPWSSNFYISRMGCGLESEIAKMTGAQVDQVTPRPDEIARLRESFDRGWPVRHKGFIYVPLQKDVNDFKFLSSPFSSNEDFLDFIHETVPPETPVWVKRHPLYKKKYNLKKYGRFKDISGKRLNKHHLYANMNAMICINSTSILEALVFGGRVFAYGEDIFNHKDLVQFRVMEPDAFARSLELSPPSERAEKFISLLLERQVNRKRCMTDDSEYVRTHYWNRQL